MREVFAMRVVVAIVVVVVVGDRFGPPTAKAVPITRLGGLPVQGSSSCATTRSTTIMMTTFFMARTTKWNGGSGSVEGKPRGHRLVVRCRSLMVLLGAR
jgi:hypothetical protein